MRAFSKHVQCSHPSFTSFGIFFNCSQPLLGKLQITKSMGFYTRDQSMKIVIGEIWMYIPGTEQESILLRRVLSSSERIGCGLCKYYGKLNVMVKYTSMYHECRNFTGVLIFVEFSCLQKFYPMKHSYVIIKYWWIPSTTKIKLHENLTQKLLCQQNKLRIYGVASVSQRLKNI